MNNTIASSTPTRPWLTAIRNAVLAYALFLLPFHYKPLFYTPSPEALDTVFSAFASIYLNISDIYLIAALALFLITEGWRFFVIPRAQRWLVIPTLGLAALAMLSATQASLPLLAVWLAARLVLMAGLVLMISRVELGWVIWPLMASALANAVMGSAQYIARGSLGLSLLGEVQVTPDPRFIPMVEAEGVFYLRALGFTVHPDILGLYLASAIILIVGMLLQRRKVDAWLASMVIGVLLLGLMLTYARAVWVGLIVSLAGLVFIHIIQPRLRSYLTALRTPALVFALLIVTFLVTQSALIAVRLSPTHSHGSTDDRVGLMLDAWSLLSQHPVTGVGGHNFSVEAARSLTVRDEYTGGFKWQPVHNYTLLIATELGVLGAVLWLWLTIFPFVRAVSLWRKLDSMATAWLGMSVVMAGNGLLDHAVWSLPEGMSLMWVIWAGLGLALDRCAQPSPALVSAPMVNPNTITLAGLTIDRQALRSVLGAFLLSRVTVLLVIFIASLVVPMAPLGAALPQPVFPGNPVLDGLVRWDSFWNSDVSSGYALGKLLSGGQSNLAFLPGYPMLAWLIAPLIGNYFFLSGVVLSNLFFLVALGYLYAVSERELGKGAAGRAVFYLACAPATIFFSALYPESLALLLSLAVFYHSGKQQWVRAGVASALAAITHRLGILTAAIIVLEGFYQQGGKLLPQPGVPWGPHIRQQAAVLRQMRSSWLAAAAAPLAFAGFLTYLGIVFGDPLLHFRALGAWGLDFTGLGAIHLIDSFAQHLGLAGSIQVGHIITALITLALIPLAVVAARQMRPAYSGFLILSLLALLGTGSIQSMPRYALVLVPIYLLLAGWGKDRRLHRLLLVISLSLAIMIAMLFSRWYWTG